VSEAADGWEELLQAVRRSRTSMMNDQQRQSALSLATSVGLRTSSRTVGCSITSRRDDGSLFTPAASGDLAVELDGVQYAAGEGPCIAATLQQRMQVIDAMAGEARWPAFAARAGAEGVHSSLSVPMRATSLPAALNLYCAVDGGYRSPRARALAKIVADAAATFMDEHRPGEEVTEEGTTQELEDALADRALVQRAQRLIMRRDGLAMAEAYRYLTSRSVAQRRRLREIAEDVLASEGGDTFEGPS
jgi:GAF domain-containing protein